MKKQYKCYERGSNDFYWVWLEDNLETFYIFPENVLIEHNYINKQDHTKTFLIITQDNWTRDYKYNLKDLNRLIDLFNK